MAATITPESVWAHIPPRARDSHKGSFGAVLVVAGSACYRGAASLAVEGALRTGAGIVTLASVEPVLAAVSARLPECCLCPCLAGAEGGISARSLPNITRQKATTLLLGLSCGALYLIRKDYPAPKPSKLDGVVNAVLIVFALVYGLLGVWGLLQLFA